MDMKRCRPWQAALLAFGGVIFTGCAGTQQPAQGIPSATRAEFCTARVVVNLRTGPGRRSDFELSDMGRRAGVQLDVMQQTGRDSRLVRIRGTGPQALCDQAVEELSLDPRIESVERYY